jgi:hypothetical protein
MNSVAHSDCLDVGYLTNDFKVHPDILANSDHLGESRLTLRLTGRAWRTGHYYEAAFARSGPTVCWAARLPLAVAPGRLSSLPSAAIFFSPICLLPDLHLGSHLLPSYTNWQVTDLIWMRQR